MGFHDKSSCLCTSCISVFFHFAGAALKHERGDAEKRIEDADRNVQMRGIRGIDLPHFGLRGTNGSRG